MGSFACPVGDRPWQQRLRRAPAGPLRPRQRNGRSLRLLRIVQSVIFGQTMSSARKSRRSSRKVSGCSSGARWPAPSIQARRAPGIVRGHLLCPRRKSTMSCSPAATRVGTLDPASISGAPRENPRPPPARLRPAARRRGAASAPPCSRAARCIGQHPGIEDRLHRAPDVSASSASSSDSHAAASSAEGSNSTGGAENSASAVNRSGATAATRIATAPPKELPASAARSSAREPSSVSAPPPTPPSGLCRPAPHRSRADRSRWRGSRPRPGAQMLRSTCVRSRDPGVEQHQRRPASELVVGQHRRISSASPGTASPRAAARRR